MVTSKNKEADFLTEFTDGTYSCECDAPEEKGGSGAAFTPMALLEASMAACMNITLRAYAKNHGLELGDVETSVTLRSDDNGTVFEYSAKLPENVAPDQKKRLLAALKGCPVHGLLSKPISFERKDG